MVQIVSDVQNGEVLKETNLNMAKAMESITGSLTSWLTLTAPSSGSAGNNGIPDDYYGNENDEQTAQDQTSVLSEEFTQAISRIQSLEGIVA